jgi:hypothetical protein
MPPSARQRDDRRARGTRDHQRIVTRCDTDLDAERGSRDHRPVLGDASGLRFGVGRGIVIVVRHLLPTLAGEALRRGVSIAQLLQEPTAIDGRDTVAWLRASRVSDGAYVLGRHVAFDEGSSTLVERSGSSLRLTTRSS